MGVSAVGGRFPKIQKLHCTVLCWHAERRQIPDTCSQPQWPSACSMLVLYSLAIAAGRLVSGTGGRDNDILETQNKAGGHHRAEARKRVTLAAHSQVHTSLYSVCIRQCFNMWHTCSHRISGNVIRTAEKRLGRREKQMKLAPYLCETNVSKHSIRR